MSRTPLDRVLNFARMLTAFGKVERMYYIPGTERKENDMEHSYLLATVAWYLIDANGLTLDTAKVLKYALAHDLVEVHAGDTYIYSTDAAHLSSKPDREMAAAERLAADFPESPDIHTYVTGYMERSDPEARFVYALDKVLPLILIREDGGRSWREEGVRLQMLIDNKMSKVAVSPEIKPYFDELIDLLKGEEGEIFG